jgi:hypothetical protein
MVTETVAQSSKRAAPNVVETPIEVRVAHLNFAALNTHGHQASVAGASRGELSTIVGSREYQGIGTLVMVDECLIRPL